MPVSTADKFAKARRKFTTTVGAGGILAGGSSLPLASVTGLPTDTPVVLMINPGGTTEEVVKGIVSGSNIVSLSKGLEGTADNPHSAAEVVVGYFTQEHWNDLIDGILAQHAADGTHAAITGPSAVFSGNVTANNFLQTGGAAANGWTVGVATPNTVTYNGNRNYSLVFNGTDLTSTLSNGMRFKLTRTVTAPTQCTSLNGTNQYYSKTSPAGMTFTDDFAVSGWIKLNSLAGTNSTIASRFNNTSGWALYINTVGQIEMCGFNAGSANVSKVVSYQSIPLNKWVHIAAQLDMSAFTANSTTSYTMIDGADAPAFVSRAGTNPTALIQAGNLEIGSYNGGTNLFPGKIAQVAIYNAHVTQATITAASTQGLAGNETALISAYSFNNTINDLNANANNLTANGSAVATNADSPFAGGANASTAVTAGTTEYGEIFGISFSTNTTIVLQVPEGYAIPTSGGISAVSYSTQSSPLGWPLPGGVRLLSYIESRNGQNFTTTAHVQFSGLSSAVYIPAGRYVKVSIHIGDARPVAAYDYFNISIWDGVVNSGTNLASSVTEPASTGTTSMSPFCEVITIPPAIGARTYNFGAATGTGGSNSTAVASVPCWIKVELV